ncbi:MAG: hypothetical protein EBZ36_08095 [Acidobacteria bacterium]|nr:hypothetical protein [Acidobacteriota bacterium]
MNSAGGIVNPEYLAHDIADRIRWQIVSRGLRLAVLLTSEITTKFEMAIEPESVACVNPIEAQDRSDRVIIHVRQTIGRIPRWQPSPKPCS